MSLKILINFLQVMIALYALRFIFQIVKTTNCPLEFLPKLYFKIYDRKEYIRWFVVFSGRDVFQSLVTLQKLILSAQI